uniref:Lipase 3 n=1 Tax=Cacopsylla melanoneura TaxID=428564 RepID=A0A8D8YIW7_9HEMI
MAMFDAPASIDYILSKSNQDKVTYIGHSMGNTIFYVMTAMRPEYNAKILVQLSLGPVAYFFHTTSPVKLVAPFAAELTKPPELLYHGELLSRSPLLNEVLRIFCTLNTVASHSLNSGPCPSRGFHQDFGSLFSVYQQTKHVSSV